MVATLTEGKYFGEIALLSFEGNNRRTADVRSVGYSELLVLSKKALMSVRTAPSFSKRDVRACIASAICLYNVQVM